MTSEFNHIVQTLKGNYSHQEATAMAEILFTDLLGFKKTDIFIHPGLQLNAAQLTALSDATQRLLNNEPVQYITGFCHFYDLKFLVNPEVLIPRPETEELVDLIIRENSHKKNTVLDVGTGSGCIAVSLKINLPDSQVFALDYKPEILSVAKENALRQSAEITFIQADLFSSDLSELKEYQFDIIVSNPPYVLNKEKQFMSERVLNHEPAEALFVPDNDPLVFYRIIIEKTLQFLKSHGKYYFEINEKNGYMMTELLSSFGLKEIRIYKDINNKNRIVFCRKD
ncbi:MAG TPA: peptide chain release factor N(5)-glutamine methyltransferase [Bacteroidia bacterium]|nr:peptide chain release factor N(5)-glutamine methyltransferase [Bacteroidia bacterium]HRS57697.1 peptide chain release factor N(5)-glutamine methyltransferase [Bacteroidia bacterium]HRU67088.1 peptide chain release factor N(5)-glutamine methyltransferase [Bacteroidia bacterium]